MDRHRGSTDPLERGVDAERIADLHRLLEHQRVDRHRRDAASRALRGADAGGEIHLLGYFVRYEELGFQRRLQELRDGRQDRAQKMVQNLNALGVEISWDRVQELSGGAAIGRPHIAQAMVEAGYVQYPRDAFEKYIGRNGPVYVERAKLTPVGAVEMVVQNGALPVMAHPTYFMAGSDEDAVDRLKRILPELKEAGLVGMEVYYGDYSPEEVESLADVAEETGLVPCGGSDYHASGNPGEPEPGSVGPPIATVSILHALRDARSTSMT